MGLVESNHSTVCTAVVTSSAADDVCDNEWSWRWVIQQFVPGPRDAVSRG